MPRLAQVELRSSTSSSSESRPAFCSSRWRRGRPDADADEVELAVAVFARSARRRADSRPSSHAARDRRRSRPCRPRHDKSAPPALPAMSSRPRPTVSRSAKLLRIALRRAPGRRRVGAETCRSRCVPVQHVEVRLRVGRFRADRADEAGDVRPPDGARRAHQAPRSCSTTVLRPGTARGCRTRFDTALSRSDRLRFEIAGERRRLVLIAFEQFGSLIVRADALAADDFPSAASSPAVMSTISEGAEVEHARPIVAPAGEPIEGKVHRRVVVRERRAPACDTGKRRARRDPAAAAG